MPQGQHKLTGLPMYHDSGGGTTSALIQNLMTLQARKEEKDRYEREAARQAEIDRLSQEQQAQENLWKEGEVERAAQAHELRMLALKEAEAERAMARKKEELDLKEKQAALKQREFQTKSILAEQKRKEQGIKPDQTTKAIERAAKEGDQDMEDLLVAPFRKALEESPTEAPLPYDLQLPKREDYAVGGLLPLTEDEELARMERESLVKAGPLAAMIRAQNAGGSQGFAPKGYDNVTDPISGKLGIIDKDTGQVKWLDTQGAPLTDELQDALGSTVARLTKDKANRISREVARRFETSSEEDAKEYLWRSALKNETVGVRGDILGRMETVKILDDARKIFEKMQAAGVPTNILAGTAEEGYRVLGKSQNPTYVALANELKSALFAYRKAMTGVQFSQKESVDYERMFPNIKNDFPVNVAAIDGLKRGFELRDNTYWLSVYTPAEAEYLGVLAGVGEPELAGSEGVPDAAAPTSIDDEINSILNQLPE